jgi:YggT family protein
MGGFLLYICQRLIGLLELVLILNAIISILVSFEIVSLRNPLARQIASFLDAVTQPILAPFRRIIPRLGGVDVSFVIVLVVMEAAQGYLLPWLFGPIIALLHG